MTPTNDEGISLLYVLPDTHKLIAFTINEDHGVRRLFANRSGKNRKEAIKAVFRSLSNTVTEFAKSVPLPAELISTLDEVELDELLIALEIDIAPVMEKIFLCLPAQQAMVCRERISGICYELLGLNHEGMLLSRQSDDERVITGETYHDISERYIMIDTHTKKQAA